MTSKTRCVVVDDEPLSRRVIAGLLESYPDFELAGEAEDGPQAIEVIERLKPDVVFLDVQMPEMDGFEVLRELERATTPLIVFVTAFDHYAVRAFDARAIDYLLKPVERERFAATIDRVRETLHGGTTPSIERLRDVARALDRNRFRQRIVVRTRDRIFFVNVDDVEWFEASANYICLHAAAREHLIRTTMHQLESELDPEFFVRIHRSVIVNLQKIVELQPFFRGDFVAVLKSGARVEVQKPYRDRLLEKFASRALRI